MCLLQYLCFPCISNTTLSLLIGVVNQNKEYFFFSRLMEFPQVGFKMRTSFWRNCCSTNSSRDASHFIKAYDTETEQFTQHIIHLLGWSLWSHIQSWNGTPVFRGSMIQIALSKYVYWFPIPNAEFRNSWNFNSTKWFCIKFFKRMRQTQTGRTRRLYKEKKLLEKASFFEAVNIPAILLGYFKYNIFEVYQ